jgi:Mg2+/Co2+ transporter CorB
MDVVTFYLISVMLLLVVSALFSCSETAITAASRAKIHRISTEGSKRAKIAEKLLKDREKVISSMLMANNAVNILASVLATAAGLAIVGEAGLIYATIIMTVLVVVFAEILPKAIALKSPDKIAILLAPVINLLVKMLFPFTHVTQKIVQSMINFVFGQSGQISKEQELEEIRDTVDLKHKEGSIFKYDKDLIDGVLDLSDTEISEIMVHRKDVESINADLPIEEIVSQALSIDYTRIPLWKGKKENVTAILNVRRLLKELHCHSENISEFDLSKVTSEPWFVPASNSLRSQLFSFRKKRKRFALVVDEYGSMLGLLTLEDILEEIVGEIKEQDGDNSDINIIRVKSGAYKITCKTLIRDINKKLDWEMLEGDNAYNLAAFIIHSLGRIPEEGEKFSINEYAFEILKKRGHDLIMARVKRG